MNKLVLFDFDGTLADSAPDLAAAANTLRERKGLPPLPYEQLRPMASQGARGLLRAALGLEPSDPDYETSRVEFLDEYKRQMTTLTCVFPGIPELLGTLKQHGYRWAIVTNKVEHLAVPIVEHLGLHTECVVTVGGDTTSHPKPHPAPLLHAAEQAGVAPSDCVYVGDDERDIIAGKAAGMPTVAAAYGYCNVSEVAAWAADAIAHSPQEVWEAIQALLPCDA